jgi:hypothetical protein
MPIIPITLHELAMRCYCLLSLALLLVTHLGCAKPSASQPVAVSGQVLLQKRPLVGGMIVFSPNRDRGNTGKTISAKLDENGNYKLAREGTAIIIPGWYRIAIAEPADLDLVASGYPHFPPALRRPDRSGLEREIRPGQENTLDFWIDVGE